MALFEPHSWIEPHPQKENSNITLLKNKYLGQKFFKICQIVPKFELYPTQKRILNKTISPKHELSHWNYEFEVVF